MKKKAFTLIESLISLTIISVVGMSFMVFVSAYQKTGYDRDIQIKTFISNVNEVEKLRAEITTLSQLHDFTKYKNVKITAVGIGEITLNSDGSYNVINDEAYMFSDSLKPKTPKLFRIDFRSDIPNSDLSTVVILK